MTWVKIVAVLGAIAAVLGAAYLIEAKWNSAIETARAEGRAEGRSAALKEVDERDNKQLQAALAEVKRLQDEKDAIERQRAADVAQAEATHAKDVAGINAQHDRVVSLLRKQRDEARTRAAAGNHDAAGQTPADTGGSDGSDWRARLSDGDVQFLVGFGRDAKIVLARLNECRATLAADRRGN